jgi:hypothetical protein
MLKSFHCTLCHGTLAVVKQRVSYFTRRIYTAPWSINLACELFHYTTFSVLCLRLLCYNLTRRNTLVFILFSIVATLLLYTFQITFLNKCLTRNHICPRFSHFFNLLSSLLLLLPFLFSELLCPFNLF